MPGRLQPRTVRVAGARPDQAPRARIGTRWGGDSRTHWRGQRPRECQRRSSRRPDGCRLLLMALVSMLLSLAPRRKCPRLSRA